MRPLLTIGGLARLAGVATSTVRYYERSGLLKPDERGKNSNYRQYHPRSVEKLRFIRSAQSIGLSLKEVAQLLDLAHSPASPCDDVMDVLTRRLEAVRTSLSDLRRVEKTLAQALKTCCNGKDPSLCEEIVRLKGI